MSAVELNEALDVRGLTAEGGHTRLSTLAELTRFLAMDVMLVKTETPSKMTLEGAT